ncbi:hypothetical protein [Rubritalea halochordaticola]
MNRDKKDIMIDQESWIPVQCSGLAAPHLKVHYHDPRVHEVLVAAFGDLFPAIVKDEKTGEFYYASNNESGRNLVESSEPVKNIADVPRAEMMRLMEGWLRLRRRLQEEKIPANLQPVLLNFHVPSPRRSLDRYRIYQQGEEKRLFILWGFEQKDAPAISVEKAIALLMDVPLGHLRSILSTSMPANTGTVPVKAVAEEAQRKLMEVKNQQDNQSGAKLMIGAIAAVFVLLLGVGAFMLLGDKDEPKQVETIVIREQVPAPPVTKAEPEVKPEPVAAPVAEVEKKAEPAPVAVVDPKPAPKPEPAKVNPLDLMAKAEPAKPAASSASLLDQMSGADTGKENPDLNGMLPKTGKKNDLLNQMTR